MAILTRSRHGVTAGVAPSTPVRTPGIRGEVDGWTNAACARNTAFLRTIDETRLDGLGIAFTGTLQQCPETHEEWKRLRELFFMRLRRMGLIRGHWVTEWQRRGVPHFHGAMYFPEPSDQRDALRLLIAVTDAWLAVAAPYGAQIGSQTAKIIWGALGWFQYTAKHASRGVSHYQRSPDCQPRHWTKTGRIWGHVGQWPTVPPEKIEVSMSTFWKLRRIARSWRISDARDEGSPRRIRSARRCLRCTHERKSPVRGISEWIPASVQDKILEHLQDHGQPAEPRHTEPLRGLAPRQTRCDPASRRALCSLPLAELTKREEENREPTGTSSL